MNITNQQTRVKGLTNIFFFFFFDKCAAYLSVDNTVEIYITNHFELVLLNTASN